MLAAAVIMRVAVKLYQLRRIALILFEVGSTECRTMCARAQPAFPVSYAEPPFLGIAKIIWRFGFPVLYAPIQMAAADRTR